MWDSYFQSTQALIISKKNYKYTKQAPSLTSTPQQKQPEENLWEKYISLLSASSKPTKNMSFKGAGKALTKKISRNGNPGKNNTGDRDS